MIDATLTRASSPAYTMTARVLHWLTAALVLTMVPLGIVIANKWGGPLQEQLYDLHKSIGSLLIPVVIIRLINRLCNPPLPLPDDIPALQQFAAHTTHSALYALLIIQPLVGWIGTSAYPAPVPFFGLFNLPSIWWEDRVFSDRMMMLHRGLGIAIAVLAVMHIAAALHHHFVRKDCVLMRMLTG